MTATASMMVTTPTTTTGRATITSTGTSVATSLATSTMVTSITTIGTSLVVVMNVPGVYEWIVPAGVTQATFQVNGAPGGTGGSFSTEAGGASGEGGGAVYTFTLSVGRVYEIRVGGQGSRLGGGSGGGGGSSFGSPGTIFLNGVQTGDGQVIISYPAP